VQLHAQLEEGSDTATALMESEAKFNQMMQEGQMLQAKVGTPTAVASSRALLGVSWLTQCIDCGCLSACLQDWVAAFPLVYSGIEDGEHNQETANRRRRLKGQAVCISHSGRHSLMTLLLACLNAVPELSCSFSTISFV
jgi:hypothetical protein